MGCCGSKQNTAEEHPLPAEPPQQQTPLPVLPQFNDQPIYGSQPTPEPLPFLTELPPQPASSSSVSPTSGGPSSPPPTTMFGATAEPTITEQDEEPERKKSKSNSSSSSSSSSSRKSNGQYREAQS